MKLSEVEWRSRAYLWTWEAEQKKEKTERLEREVEKLGRELASLESSLSWRLTAPLRALDGALRKIARGRTEKAGDEFGWIDALSIRHGGNSLVADCSMTIRGVSSPGMRRVTTGLVKGSSGGGTPLVPVDLLGGPMREAAEAFGAGIPDGQAKTEWTCGGFLMLDASWSYCEAMERLGDRFRAAGVPVWALVHDVIPLDHPELCLPEVVQRFSTWTHMVFRCCDGIVCVSETTARNTRRHYEHSHGTEGKLQIIPWLPGSESMKLVVASDQLVPPDDFFLCVGTIEPRKNYGVLLDAMTELWESGRLGHRLVIFGDKGWGVEELVERILGHREWGNKLWWFEGGSDEHLRALYQNCKAFVLPSIDEGFSQPLSEASQFQKPIVMSDIPIFRERVICNGIFFNLRDPKSLKEALETAASQASATKVHATTWTESAACLRDLIARNTAPVI